MSFTRNKTIRNIAHLRLLLRVACEEDEEDGLFDSSDPVMVEDNKEGLLIWGKVDNRKAKNTSLDTRDINTHKHKHERDVRFFFFIILSALVVELFFFFFIFFSRRIFVRKDGTTGRS